MEILWLADQKIKILFRSGIRPRYVPVVLSRAEVEAVLSELEPRGVTNTKANTKGSVMTC